VVAGGCAAGIRMASGQQGGTAACRPPSLVLTAMTYLATVDRYTLGSGINLWVTSSAG